jgi:hypothetical protein
MHLNSNLVKAVLSVVIVHLSVGLGISRAESILLAQLYNSHGWTDDPGETIRLSFVTYAGPGDEIRLSTTPTLADIGKTYIPDAATLGRFAEVLTTSTGGRSIDSGIGVGSPRHASVDEFFDGPFMGEFPTTHSRDNLAFIMKAFVPQLGRNFSGYRITHIDQTINGISMEQLNSTTVLYWGAQTIRIFGEQIPEPVTAFFVAQSLVLLAGRQKRFTTVFPDDRD